MYVDLKVKVKRGTPPRRHQNRFGGKKEDRRVKRGNGTRTGGLSERKQGGEIGRQGEMGKKKNHHGWSFQRKLGREKTISTGRASRSRKCRRVDGT